MHRNLQFHVGIKQRTRIFINGTELLFTSYYVLGIVLGTSMYAFLVILTPTPCSKYHYCQFAEEDPEA